MAAHRRQTAPTVLGITGPIGCGKTTVGDLLLSFGAGERIDADQIVHQLMEPDTDVTHRVIAAFGSDVQAPDGSVDRGRLAQLVFADTAELRRLEAIVHPAVRDVVRARLARLTGESGVIVIDAVRLLQSELRSLVDAVWVVTCPRAIELERLVTLRAMTADEANARIDAQPSFEHPTVSRVINNAGSLDDLRAQVMEGWKALTAT